MKTETNIRLTAQRKQSIEDLEKLLTYMNYHELNTEVLKTHSIVYELDERIWAWTTIVIKNSKAMVNLTDLHKVVNKFVNFEYLQFCYVRSGSLLRVNYIVK